MQAVGKLYDFLIWFSPRVVELPRLHRSTLGMRILSKLHDTLDDLLDASYTGDLELKRGLLSQANRRLEHLRLLVRACRDLGLLTPERHEHSARRIDEVGRLVGGVLRARAK